MRFHGYRSPQFSEDAAWLPAWLQPHQFSSSYMDSQAIIHLTHKDVAMSQQNVSIEPKGSLCPPEGSQFNSIHLFLSGSSSLPVTETPPSGDQVLQLHLSSIGITQDPSSAPWNSILTKRPEPGNMLYVQPLPGTSHDQTGQKDVVALVEIPPKHRKYPENSLKRKKLKRKRKKFDDAVELSIAASEALAISELLKCDDNSEIFHASAVVEIALKLKQARNQHCSNLLEDISSCLPKEVSETDQLRELDENCMQSAFEDVGLSIAVGLAAPEDNSLIKTYSECFPKGVNLDVSQGSGSLTSSPLSDTLASEDESKLNAEANNNDTKAEEVEIVGNTCENKSDDVFPAAVQCVDLEPEAADAPQGPEEGTSSCCLAFKRISANSAGVTQIPTRVGVLVKDVGTKLCGVRKSGKSIPNPFVEVTSFLSESVDIVTDENSVQIQAMGPSSSCQDAEGAFVSQDYMGSSNFSLVEPLCSVVPCSITSYDDHLGDVAQVPDEKSMQQHINIEILHQDRLPNAAAMLSKASFPARKESRGSKNDGEGSGSASWKRLSSLRSYSVHFDDVRKEEMYFQDGLKALTGVKDRINHIPATTQILQHMSKYQDSDEQQTCALFNQKGYSESKKASIQKQNIKPRVTELNSGLYNEQRCLPLVLNSGTRRRLLACKIIASDLAEGSLERDPSPHKKAKLFNCKGDTSRGSASKVTTSPTDSDLLVRHHVEKPLIKKRVHFLDDGIKLQEDDVAIKQPLGIRIGSLNGTNQRVKRSHRTAMSGSGGKKFIRLKNSGLKDGTTLIFLGLEFMLTGDLGHRQKELAMLIRKNGGVVLDDIPPSLSNYRRKRRSKIKRQRLPLVISPGKVQTKTFLYGCAVKALVLIPKWLTDSVDVGYVVPPHKYLILSHQMADSKRMIVGQAASCRRSKYIFENVGIMVHGKPSFCTMFVDIIKHGGGQVFKTLHWLVQSLKSRKNTAGAIVVENEVGASRHLSQCALEQHIPVMPVSWIIDSLHSGMLLPVKKNDLSPLSITTQTELVPDINLSIEI